MTLLFPAADNICLDATLCDQFCNRVVDVDTCSCMTGFALQENEDGVATVCAGEEKLAGVNFGLAICQTKFKHMPVASG